MTRRFNPGCRVRTRRRGLARNIVLRRFTKERAVVGESPRDQRARNRAGSARLQHATFKERHRLRARLSAGFTENRTGSSRCAARCSRSFRTNCVVPEGTRSQQRLNLNDASASWARWCATAREQGALARRYGPRQTAQPARAPTESESDTFRRPSLKTGTARLLFDRC